MRRWGNGEKYLERIEQIRSLRPDAAFRSNFIVGYPGETEEDHDDLLRFVDGLPVLGTCAGLILLADTITGGLGDQETFGMVLLETLACGVPVLGMAAGAVPELVDSDCGMLVAPRSVAVAALILSA